jgi:hypothetical protein
VEKTQIRETKRWEKNSVTDKIHEIMFEEGKP